MGVPDGSPFRTIRDLAGWLDRAGLLGERSVVGIERRPARRVAALVHLSDGSSLFVKHLATAGGPPGPAREAACLRLIQRRHELAVFRQVVPSLRHYDQKADIIVTEGFAGYETLRAQCRSHPAIDPSLLEQLACQLARCHGSASAEAMIAEEDVPLHAYPPVTTYGHVTPARLAHGVGHDFAMYLRVAQTVDHRLRRLKDDWAGRCLIHGDFKDDNILIAAPAPDGEVPLLRIVDWELAGLGDPLWDVGCLVGQIVSYWIRSIRPSSTGSFLSWIEEASVPFETARASISTFLAAYGRFSASAGSRSLDGLQATIIQYAGIFLMHRSRVSLEIYGTVTPFAYCCLHVGRTFVADPQRSADTLLDGRGERR